MFTEMKFCQLQINYIDWTFQNAKEKVELVTKYHIPVWVLEPLRGGKLAVLPYEYEKSLKNLRPSENTPAWAFRFLQSIKEVTVTLSGMSNMEQLKENMETFEEELPLNEEEKQKLSKIAEQMIGRIALPCTGCSYCIEKCPKRLDIPKLLSLYNEHIFTGGGFLPEFGLRAIKKEKHPDVCIGCRRCESICPQQIKISEAMADFAKK